jgi:SAM-dependent methyltransferase
VDVEPGSSDLVAQGYDAFYSSWGKSPTLRRIWREHVTGPDYPEAFAHISFVTLEVLGSLTESLELAPDQLLVDLACGAGGPGLWAASERGARLVGRDLSTIAVDCARARVREVGMEGRAEFGQGTFEDTGVGDGVADGVMTVDALQYAPDKSKAIAEMARILRPGGRLAFVAFELDAERIAGVPDVWQDPVGDYRPLLERNGFTIHRYEQLTGWRDQVAAGFGAVVAAQETLAVEMGPDAAAATVLEASITLQLEPYCGHVLVAATAG